MNDFLKQKNKSVLRHSVFFFNNRFNLVIARILFQSPTADVYF
jgi:hypothetical protein